MEKFLFVLGIVLSIIFLMCVFGWKLREHNDVMDELYEDEMWKDSQ